MAGTDWSSLTMTAEKLQANAITDTGMPSVTRNIRQLLDAAENLWTKVGVPGMEAQGNVFLCSRGVDAPQVPKQLEKLNSTVTLDTLDPKPDMDVDSFVKNEVQNAILSLIESVKKSNEDFLDDRQKDTVIRNWKNKKMNIINSFPGYMPNSSISDSNHIMPSINKFNSTNFGLNAHLDQTELVYAKHLCEYNQHVENHGVQTDILQSFTTAAEISHDDRINEMWKIVKCMSQIVPEHGSNRTRNSVNNQNIMIGNARSYLEQRYIAFMKSYVKNHLSKAKLGGIPGTYPLVRSFVSVYIKQYSNPSQLFYDGLPFWPLLYYLIRCGDLESVVRVLEKNNQDPELLNVFTNIKNNHQYTNLNNQGFSSTIAWDSNDPFKRVIYSLVAAFDVTSKHSDVIKTADDYLWLKLCQVRNDQDKLTYSVLQSMIHEEYKDQFSEVQPMSYFQLLFLTGQFESAIQFIFCHPKLRSHAIHVAIVLNEMGLLNLPDDFDQPILFKDNEITRLNLARMIIVYCASFENQDLKMAINYYYCLRNTESHGVSLFISCVADLVIETEEYDKVFGYLKPDGKKQNGILDSFTVLDTVKMDIIRTTASLAEKKCDFEVAAKLYELVSKYDKVIELANIMLSRIIQPDTYPSLNKTSNMKNKVFDYVELLSQRLTGIEINVSDETIFTFNILKSVFVFFEQYNNHNYTRAFDVLQTIGLVPLSVDQVEERLVAFKKYDELVLRIVPGVMTATMNMLYSQHSEIKKEETNKHVRDPEQRQAQLEYIREKARAITSFTGRVPFQINSEVINHLVQTEILLY